MTDDAAFESTCVTCGNHFLVPRSERHFRRDRGLPDPVECPECRSRARAVRNADLIALYDQGNALVFTEPAVARRSSSAQRERNGHRPQASRQRYNTVCAACGAETQVPFVPRGDRPVYCRDCFNARRGR